MTYLDPMLKRRTVLGGALSLGAVAAGASLSWKYFAAPKQAIFDPDEDCVAAYHKAVNTMVPMAVPSPVANITSPTNDKLGAKINKAIGDVRDDILAGRKKMAEWEPAVAKWRTDGGDKIRDEYQQALAAS